MYSYDLQTDIGKVRLLIQDTNIENNGKYCVFNDGELRFFLDESTNNIYLASALALETNATNSARLAKRKSVNKISMDTTQISEQLLELADRYKEKAVLEGNIPEGTSILDINQMASALLDLELTGRTPRTDREFAKQWLGD